MVASVRMSSACRKPHVIDRGTNRERLKFSEERIHNKQEQRR